MKRFPIIIIFLFTSFNYFGQKHSTELEKSYTKKELSSFDFQTLKILEYGIDHAIYFSELPSEKSVLLQEISIKSKTNKYTDLGLKILNENQYFKVRGTNKLMVVKSMYVLSNEFKNKKD